MANDAEQSSNFAVVWRGGADERQRRDAKERKHQFGSSTDSHSHSQSRVLLLRSVSVARSGPARSSRRGVESKEIRAQAREVRMASVAWPALTRALRASAAEGLQKRRMTTAVSLNSSRAKLGLLSETSH